VFDEKQRDKLIKEAARIKKKNEK